MSGFAGWVRAQQPRAGHPVGALHAALRGAQPSERRGITGASIGGPPRGCRSGRVPSASIRPCSRSCRPRGPGTSRRVPHKSDDARLVSLADKVHNAREILDDYRRDGEALWSRFNGGRDGTLWCYRALADAFRGRTPPRLCQALEETVVELERLAGAPRPTP